MIPYTRSAVAAVSLSAVLAGAVAACASTGEPVAEAPAATAESTYAAAPRLGTASAALQTGVSTGTITRAPQRPAPVPPPPATGPSIVASHAAAAGAPRPIIPEPAPAAELAPAAPAAAAPSPAPAPAPAAEPASLGAAGTAEGRRLFNAFSCGACHALADAGGEGQVGPALDGNAALTRDYVTTIVANGRGAMPAFAGQMTDEEIATLAAYIVAAKK